ncbi:hypothetical protein AVV48_gp56 [Acinetobacter phage phiAC-1]|nr:hypothetical protein AVV48_gp56 [Acinetobacter phage phiAC-1]AFU62305.1 hypothetical protein phiAC-1_0056 [Acinetobacter phage phiAC-1]
MCSYQELNSCIGLEGALRIIEVWQVATYNENKIKYLLNKESKNG